MRSVRSRITRSAAVAAASTALLAAVAMPVQAVEDPDVDDTTSFITGTETDTDDLDLGTGADVETDPDLDPLAVPDASTPSTLPSGSASSGSASLTVTPAVVTAGAEVVIRIEGCKEKKGVATSEAFVADAHVAASDEGGEVLSAEATVRSSTEPGTYTIEHRDCKVRGSLTVTASASASASVGTLKPSAPVRAGGGGTAAEGGRTGPDVSDVALGLGLAGGAAIAVAGIAVRRRRSRVRSD